jgi:copper transport protein
MTSPRRRGPVATVTAVLVAALVLVLTPARADAHAELLSTEPASGEQLDTPPDRVVLHFSEAVSLTDDTLQVLDATGEPVDHGEPEHPDGQGASVAVTVPPDLADGAYVVAWRVVSSDSHPIGGAFTFRVGAAAAAPVDDQALIADVLGGSRDGDQALGAVYGVVRFLAFGGLTVLVGSLLFLAFLWPAGQDDRRARRVVATGWCVSLVATVLTIPLQAAYVAGGTLGDVLDPSLAADELGVRTGRVWAARLALLLALGALLWLVRRPREARWNGGVLAALGLALLVTVSLTGHAVSGDLVPLAFVTDVVHLGGVSVWLGGLTVMVAALLRLGAPSSAGDDDDPAGAVETVVGRFSQVAFVAVVTIVASGAIQGWRQVGSYDALLETTYGQLLVIKVLLVGGMLVGAAFSRSWIRQRAAARTAALALSPGPGAVATSADGGRARLTVLHRSVGAEVALAVGVLAVTALLVNAVPGETAAGDGGGPYATTLTGEDLSVSVDVDPAAVGPVDIHVYVNDRAGAPLQPEELTLSLTLPERDLGPIDVPMVAYGSGHYSADGAEIPLAGDWDMEVVVRTSDIDQTRLDTVVPVS